AGREPRRRHLDVGPVEEAVRLRQLVRELHADRLQRMLRTEVVRSERVVPRNQNALAHARDSVVANRAMRSASSRGRSIGMSWMEVIHSILTFGFTRWISAVDRFFIS